MSEIMVGVIFSVGHTDISWGTRLSSVCVRAFIYLVIVHFTAASILYSIRWFYL